MKISLIAVSTMLAVANAACQPQASTAETEEPRASASSLATHAEAMPDPDEASGVIQGVMDAQYGGAFDSSLDCWRYTATVNEDELDYCMRPGKAEIVDVRDGRHIFFIAFSVTDAWAAQPRFLYGHLDPGLMGAFEISIDSGNEWSSVAASKAMQFGSMGNCGCENADFVRLGKERHGWTFVSGGTWQGTTVAFHSIIARRGHEFEDVSRIPMIEEGAQDVEYSIAFDDSDLGMAMFPVIVTRADASGRSTRLKVPFDTKKWAYEMEGTRK